MGKLTTTLGEYKYLWASDIEFDGIRLEISDQHGEHWFQISVPEVGPTTVNTFARDVPTDVILCAILVAEQRDPGSSPG
ncbi:hypothetical protein M3P36_00615 [Altererythrobacter sp. KTW20L]|uniref:hypothetical protein n=1 Tax=Altererythrobacter sp. KTW20L TaxID=2942210 RepID=UPI0020C0415A|nr:hypothetical protein [Altererythrobacter sp. KTW20L]MCL6249551.1 hypothetical protein [Altererythrobacter sp. KTW20L]